MAEYIVDTSKIEHVPQISKETAYEMLFGECGVPLYERIVRCKDCKHCADIKNYVMGIEELWCDVNRHVVENYGFCAWGEER